MKKLLTILIMSLFSTQNAAQAQLNIPDTPEYNVYDPHNYLSVETVNKLVAFNKKHKDVDQMELGVAIVDSLDRNEIQTVANEIAKKWKIGYSGENRGAVLVIALKEKKYRIETSNAIQDELTKDEATHILNSAVSYMRKSDYDSAVYNIITQIDKEITFKPIAEIKQEKDNKSENILYYIFIISSVALVVLTTLILISSKKKEQKTRPEMV